MADVGEIGRGVLTDSAAPSYLVEPIAKKRAMKPEYSVATEQVVALDHMVQLMIASRHLQLETLSTEPQKEKLESFRATILSQARDMTAIVVQMGATNHLAHCDISKTFDREHAHRSGCISPPIYRSPPTSMYPVGALRWKQCSDRRGYQDPTRHLRRSPSPRISIPSRPRCGRSVGRDHPRLSCVLSSILIPEPATIQQSIRLVSSNRASR